MNDIRQYIRSGGVEGCLVRQILSPMISLPVDAWTVEISFVTEILTKNFLIEQI
jgi:hypothetical protein